MAQPGEKRPRGGDIAARVRAAAAWSDLDRVKFGARIGYSKETVSALFSGEKEPDSELRAKIASATGVPPWFMEHGFAPMQDSTPDIRDDLNQLRAAMLEQASSILGLRREIEELRGRDRRQGEAEGPR